MYEHAGTEISTESRTAWRETGPPIGAKTLDQLLQRGETNPMLTKPALSDPILIDTNIARFRAPDPLDDVYVQIILAPDTYYPCVFCYRGVISFPNMAHIESLREMHPKLARLADLLQSPHRGWKTSAFDEIVSLLSMSQISIMPNFPEPHRLCGKGFCRKDFQLAGGVASSVLWFGIDAWI